MDNRKLIRFGNSSHIVTLPNSWVKKNKLKKGDLIYFEENGNNELVLSSELKKEEYKKNEISINISNKPLPTIEREIMNSYINNYDVININGDLKKYRKEIGNIINNLLVLEIMEETPNKIVVKDFLNLNEVSINDNIRRIDLTVRSMMIYLKEVLENNVDNYENIAYLDLRVNKFRFLVYRVINRFLKNTYLESKNNFSSYIDLFNYRFVINNLEDIADECKRISRFLSKTKIKKNDKNEIKKIYLEIEKGYLDAMKAHYTNNKQLAHDVASRKDSIIEECRNLFKICGDKNVGVILEKLKGMESFIRNIARIVIDAEYNENGKNNLSEK